MRKRHFLNASMVGALVTDRTALFVRAVDRFADMAAKPVTERFGSCPWATYPIEVKEA
jgi:hypothetical protein